MEKEGNYLGNFPTLDYNHDNQHQEAEIGASSSDLNNNNNNVQNMVDYNPPLLQQQPAGGNFYGSNSFDKLSFADVMQFADFGPKLNQSKSVSEEETAYFLKFPVLNDHKQLQDEDEEHHLNMMADEQDKGDEENSSVQLRFNSEGKSIKRKRGRSVKSIEEVESQRMTHIAVERNRRKQMNEHLRVLRSLMPTSYVQRGDQASIIGGAIEFVRELEQLLQCLESQKRRRLYGEGGQSSGAGMPTNEQLIEVADGLQVEEESAESKSCLADVEVKVVGFDALIKILSRRRPEQLIKTIAALEDLHLTILHTNITTIEQTVLYSFNVKIGGEARFTAEDLANSIQQIFSFIHANTRI